MTKAKFSRGVKLSDKFIECLEIGREIGKKFGLKKDYILFIHATSEGGLAHAIDEVFEDGFLTAGVFYGFHFPFSPINEKIAVKIKRTEEQNETNSKIN